MENNENQNNINQAMPEVKTEEVAKKEKKKKEPKQPKEKKEQPDTQDQLCYLGALIFLVLGLLPILLRNFDPNYDPYRDTSSGNGGDTGEAIIQKLKCSKAVEQEGYSYVIDVSTNYNNEVPEASEIVYSISLQTGSTIDLTTLDVQEFVDLSTINSSGISGEDRGITTIDGKTTKTQIITLKYKEDPTLLNNPLLDSHNKNITIQESNYREDSYMCSIT
ncbi:MAG: hypothetical protein IJN90_03420 [Bacilli bacterium]|nr:hypothetical protein [Bacilli bacterium]